MVLYWFHLPLIEVNTLVETHRQIVSIQTNIMSITIILLFPYHTVFYLIHICIGMQPRKAEIYIFLAQINKSLNNIL